MEKGAYLHTKYAEKILRFPKFAEKIWANNLFEKTDKEEKKKKEKEERKFSLKLKILWILKKLVIEMLRSNLYLWFNFWN